MLIKVHDWHKATQIESVAIRPLKDDWGVVVKVSDAAPFLFLPTAYATREEACAARDAFAESVNAALKSPA